MVLKAARLSGDFVDESRFKRQMDDEAFYSKCVLSLRSGICGELNFFAGSKFRLPFVERSTEPLSRINGRVIDQIFAAKP